MNCLTECIWVKSPDIFMLKKSVANLNANVPQLHASGNADGMLRHMQNYQQLQKADEQPHHS